MHFLLFFLVLWPSIVYGSNPFGFTSAEYEQACAAQRAFDCAPKITPAFQAVISQQMKVYDQYRTNDMDVHTANHSFLKGIFQGLSAADPEWGTIPVASVALLETIKKEALPQHQGYFQASTALLQGFLTSTDPETGAHIGKLLNRVWQLTCRVGSHHQFAYDPAGPIMNAKQYFAWSISENTETGGGCLAGFAGRLVRNYIEALTAIVE